MSDATGLMVGLIALASTGITKKFLSDQPVVTVPNGKPPTSEAGVRPQCAIGEKAVHFTNPDRWVCVPDFK